MPFTGIALETLGKETSALWAASQQGPTIKWKIQQLPSLSKLLFAFQIHVWIFFFLPSSLLLDRALFGIKVLNILLKKGAMDIRLITLTTTKEGLSKSQWN